MIDDDPAGAIGADVPPGVPAKTAGAFLTISELSAELGVAQHILRYWETRFPQLKPLQRAGNRRYYRPSDVALARRINGLLSREGYTVRGVQQLLGVADVVDVPTAPVTPAAGTADMLSELRAIREMLAAALAA